MYKSNNVIRVVEILLSYCYIFKAKWIHSVCLTVHVSFQ